MPSDEDEWVDPIPLSGKPRRKRGDDEDESQEAYIKAIYKVLVTIMVLIIVQFALGLIAAIAIATSKSHSPF